MATQTVIKIKQTVMLLFKFIYYYLYDTPFYSFYKKHTLACKREFDIKVVDKGKSVILKRGVFPHNVPIFRINKKRIKYIVEYKNSQHLGGITKIGTLDTSIKKDN